MAGFSTDHERRIIPRWRPFATSITAREFASSSLGRVHQEINDDLLRQKLFDWEENKTVGRAADLVGSAVTLGLHRDATEAARFLLKDHLSVSPWARELAHQVLDNRKISTVIYPVSVTSEGLQNSVHALRQYLRQQPRDAIGWVELSRAYANLGVSERASDSMAVALQLAKDNRFVLRAAGRLWVHLGEFDRAHEVISRSGATRYDPWLRAAEIAIATVADRRIRGVRGAREMLSEDRFEAIHVSELAAALATIEMTDGNRKKARVLFRRSLEDPTDNAIAQAAWAARRDGGSMDPLYVNRVGSFESDYWYYVQDGQWKKAIESCMMWQDDEPYSSRPGIQGSFVAAVMLEKFEIGERFARTALRANPDDFVLLNNLAFSLIGAGRTSDAGQVLDRLRKTIPVGKEAAVFNATCGLLDYRLGKKETGGKAYADAHTMAMATGDRGLAAMVLIFHAIELSRQCAGEAEMMRKEALRALEREQRSAANPIYRMLETKLRKLG